MSRSGGTRRWAAVVAAAVSLGVLAGCSQMNNPSYDLTKAGCARVADSVLATIQDQLTVKGQLRNGSQSPAPGGDKTFVSAELHLDSAKPHAQGDILTWVTSAVDSGHFAAVDVNARDDGSWPHSELDVRAPGARESRACAATTVGKTPGQIKCEQDKLTGQVPISNKDCSKQ